MSAYKVNVTLEPAVKRAQPYVGPHTLRVSAFPAADGFQGECSCGWRTVVCSWDYEPPSAPRIGAEIDRRFLEHKASATCGLGEPT